MNWLHTLSRNKLMIVQQFRIFSIDANGFFETVFATCGGSRNVLNRPLRHNLNKSLNKNFSNHSSTWQSTFCISLIKITSIYFHTFLAEERIFVQTTTWRCQANAGETGICLLLLCKLSSSSLYNYCNYHP